MCGDVGSGCHGNVLCMLQDWVLSALGADTLGCRFEIVFWLHP